MATTGAAATETGGKEGGAGTQRVVLISVDDSEQSEKAFDYYVNNLHRAENKILCFHVSQPPYVSPSTTVFMGPEILEELIEQEKQRTKALEMKYEAKLKQHDVSGHVKSMFYHHPGEAIVKEAAKENVSNVVMGTRGLGLLRRTILGSVSQYVLHHVDCPVVICRK